MRNQQQACRYSGANFWAQKAEHFCSTLLLHLYLLALNQLLSSPFTAVSNISVDNMMLDVSTAWTVCSVLVSDDTLTVTVPFKKFLFSDSVFQQLFYNHLLLCFLVVSWCRIHFSFLL
jgi:hypothetical protein